MHAEFGVLGPVAAWTGGGEAIPLKGPRHRAVLARLLVARGRAVPTASLVADLWVDARCQAGADTVKRMRLIWHRPA